MRSIRVFVNAKSVGEGFESFNTVNVNKKSFQPLCIILQLF